MLIITPRVAPQLVQSELTTVCASEHRSNFEKYDISTIDTLDTMYDYGSIMHYQNNTFAMDRSRITINHTLPLPPGVEMGQRVKLSETDITKLKRLYKCSESPYRSVCVDVCLCVCLVDLSVFVSVLLTYLSLCLSY